MIRLFGGGEGKVASCSGFHPAHLFGCQRAGDQPEHASGRMDDENASRLLAVDVLQGDSGFADLHRDPQLLGQLPPIVAVIASPASCLPPGTPPARRSSPHLRR